MGFAGRRSLLLLAAAGEALQPNSWVGCGIQVADTGLRLAPVGRHAPFGWFGPWAPGRRFGRRMIARVQYAVLGATALVAVALSVVQTHLDRSVFERYLGAINPVAAMIVASVVAFGSLGYLRSHGSFEIAGRECVLGGLRFTAVAAPLFAGAAIGADLLLRYPQDMNVTAPDALFFYPAIGFLVEVGLHTMPLALLIALFVRSDIVPDRTFWLLAIPVAMLEAVLQMATATTAATAVFSGLQLLAFGLVQLFVFRRFGFVSMYAFRLAYYLLWHVAWGAIRLHWLF